MSDPVKCCHHSTGGTPSSLNVSKNFSSTGLTSFLKPPSLVIVTIGGANLCGENRESIEASCFSVIKLKMTDTRPLVFSCGKASRMDLLSAVNTPRLIWMMAWISVWSISLQSEQGLVSIEAAARAAVVLACFDIDPLHICERHRRLNSVGKPAAAHTSNMAIMMWSISAPCGCCGQQKYSKLRRDWKIKNDYINTLLSNFYCIRGVLKYRWIPGHCVTDMQRQNLLPWLVCRWCNSVSAGLAFAIQFDKWNNSTFTVRAYQIYFQHAETIRPTCWTSAIF